jgi:hypothetical protein
VLFHLRLKKLQCVNSFEIDRTWFVEIKSNAVQGPDLAVLKNLYVRCYHFFHLRDAALRECLKHFLNYLLDGVTIGRGRWLRIQKCGNNTKAECEEVLHS